MSKGFMELIREISNRYDVELEKVEDNEKAGIFVEVEGKDINVAELDEQEVFNSIFKNTNKFEYRVLDIKITRDFKNKKLNILENRQDYSIKYNIDKERVA